ncbi:flagellar brake domain-containing protein [Alkalihalobacillus sp. MEB130]|uniref:flagellar brake protein n=1 Tax=Alkalihalobacillus sp. MEB130 TaxID=2976704 RepID=UPI0028DE68A0|nr:flagellar brake domain-containing protein [Alkalihalobacillus sp. MEB130]MDT8860033.1 flagellar brake domain-containing protein [Alkalihalobacillus sp. MEB130]
MKIGLTIFLELQERKDSEKGVQRFKCRLVDIKDAIYVIDYPINEETGKPSFFFDGTEFRASFITEDESAMYAFDTEIVGRMKGNIPVLFLKDPGKEKYIRIQRRNYVRVETAVDVAIHPINSEFSPFTTVTLDLSGGGCAILLPQNQSFLEQGQTTIHLVLHMQTGDIVYVKALCKVVRVFTPRKEARRRASLQFLDIDERDQQKIIRYCFERQLALRRKEGK